MDIEDKWAQRGKKARVRYIDELGRLYGDNKDEEDNKMHLEAPNSIKVKRSIGGEPNEKG